MLLGHLSNLRVINDSKQKWCDVLSDDEATPRHHPLRSLQWRHNGRDGISNHQPHKCLLNLLFKVQIKETSKLRITGLCEGNSPVTGDPHKGPVTRKMFPFDDVILIVLNLPDILPTAPERLTHWGWDKMAAISQTTFSSAFFRITRQIWGIW